MKKICRIRFYPNQSQIHCIDGTLGCCRYIQNKYIEYNTKSYEERNEFISGYDFSKMINKLKKNEPEYEWISKYSTKAISDAILNEEKAYKKFFKTKKGYPKFKSRKKLTKESFFFIKDNIHFDTKSEYIIKIPILGNIRILQKNQLPDIKSITSGRVIKDKNKYYVMFIYDCEPETIELRKNLHVGIDLGVKNYASIYLSDDISFTIHHYKDNPKYKEIKEKIIYYQQVINYKQQINYGKLLNEYLDNHNGEEPSDKYKNIMKGKSYQTSRIRGLRKKISRLYEKLNNIRIDFINKLVHNIVTRIKPQSITIEDLKITEMLQNDNTSKLHELLQESCLYLFRQKLIQKCSEYGIEVRLANKFYASSKICSNCGNKKKDLKLSDRIYHCDCCGYEKDRDMNAAINLCNLKKKYYTIEI